jgi:hypothetical protein
MVVTSQIESCLYSKLDGCSSHSLSNLDDSFVRSSLILVVLLDLLMLCNAPFFQCPCSLFFFSTTLFFGLVSWYFLVHQRDT